MTYAADRNRLFAVELVVGIWCLIGTAVYLRADHFLVGHFLLIYAVGYGAVGLISWYQGRRI
jgi:hypothetical protein